MFALAILYTITCVCGIIWTTIQMAKETMGIMVCLGHTSILFSVLLLIFVAIERLLAMRCPHYFTRNASRVMKAQLVIGVMDAGCATTL